MNYPASLATSAHRKVAGKTLPKPSGSPLTNVRRKIITTVSYVMNYLIPIKRWCSTRSRDRIICAASFADWITARRVDFNDMLAE
jgi:hypothetical protein